MNEKKKVDDHFRQPIITVVGHIDHGKTTLINCIGKITNIQEHGGITQHVKAYNFNTKYGFMTFLDTPGHFAFNSLRENSIKYCDIVLLVIAADDGIKPQTIESIELAKKFSIPIIVAINKVDKVDDIDKVDKTKIFDDKIISELSKYGLISESWGGDTIIVNISGKTELGVDNLLELIKIQADMLDLKVDYEKPFYGIVLDNKIDIGLGAVSTLILKNGILKIGDTLNINNYFGKVKSIFKLNGVVIKEAYPSLPINVTGLSSSIDIGEIFLVSNSEKNLKKNSLKNSLNNDDLSSSYNLDYLIKNLKKSSEIKLNLIIKADVQGSLNVLKNSISKLSTSKVKINLVKLELGNFNESDIDLSVTTHSFLIGFNIKITSKIKQLAVKFSVKFNIFNVIYDLIDFLENEIKSKEEIKLIEDVIGIAEVRKVFKTNDNSIAGCFVTYGKIKSNCGIKIFRKNALVFQGFIDCIKNFKTMVNEVKLGHECGITIKNYSDFQINDKINFY
ncbi:MAG TPA: translation initiation factor IF-2 [Candidatus Azoamicus sp.]